jgi:ABC-type transport system substrate-binding protein
MHVHLSNWVVMYPQVLTPSPAIVGDVRLRRGLMHALDRQEMADSLLQPGISSPAHNFLAPGEPEYEAVQPFVTQYDFDPRRAAQVIESLGYSRGGDGNYRDASGQPLTLEIRNRGIEIGTKAMFAAADYWKRAGIPTETIVVPPQRGQDRQYMSTFPGFLLYHQSTDLPFLKRLVSSQTPLPENDFVGQNNSRYMSAEFDSLVDRVFSTIPRQERMQVLGATVRHLTDNVLLLGLFYNALPTMVGNRLKHLAADPYGEPWNAHEWDVS